jgi:hypothetical protein
MTHFANTTPTADPKKLTVTQVIVAEQDFINTLPTPATWYQTSYNTRGNKHYAPSPPAAVNTLDNGTPLRANYAGIGHTLDLNYTINGVVGVFYGPQPFPDWILNTTTFLWEAPIPMPTTGGPYRWDETTHNWVTAK